MASLNIYNAHRELSKARLYNNMTSVKIKEKQEYWSLKWSIIKWHDPIDLKDSVSYWLITTVMFHSEQRYQQIS